MYKDSSTSFKRDLYFSEQQRQELRKLVVNTQKLSINEVQKFCRESKQEILQKIRSAKEGGKRNGKYDDDYDSSEFEEELIIDVKPYVSKPPIGVFENTEMTPEEIELMRTSFIEQIFYSTKDPIAWEDLSSCITHMGQQHPTEHILQLFGFTTFPALLREMPELAFLDVYMAPDYKLWFVNNQMPSKTKFLQREVQPMPLKGIKITIADTVYNELDFIHFAGRLEFIATLNNCIKDGHDDREGWIPFGTFQEYFCKRRKTDINQFKSAWKTLINDIGKLQRVWYEICYRDIIYDPIKSALKLKDGTAQEIYRRIIKEENEAKAFWDDFVPKANAFLAEQQLAMADDQVPEENVETDESENIMELSSESNLEDIDNGMNISDIQDAINEANDAPLPDDDDDELEEEEICEKHSPPVEEDPIEEYQLAAPEPVVEEEKVEAKNEKLTFQPVKFSRVNCDDSESDDEDHRVENNIFRGETLVIPTKRIKEAPSATESSVDGKANGDDDVGIEEQCKEETADVPILSTFTHETDTSKANDGDDNNSVDIEEVQKEETVGIPVLSTQSDTQDVIEGEECEREKANNDIVIEAEVINEDVQISSPIVDSPSDTREPEKAKNDTVIEAEVINEDDQRPSPITDSSSDVQVSSPEKATLSNTEATVPAKAKFDIQQKRLPRAMPTFKLSSSTQSKKKVIYDSDSDEEDIRCENLLSRADEMIIKAAAAKSASKDTENPEPDTPEEVEESESDSAEEIECEPIKKGLFPKSKANLCNFIPPANQESVMMDSLNELCKKFGIDEDDESWEKVKNTAPKIPAAKPRVNDFGSDPEYSEDEEEDFSNIPSPNSGIQSIESGSDGARDTETERVLSGDIRSSSFKPFRARPAQFQGCLPSSKKMPSPRKNHNVDVENGDAE